MGNENPMGDSPENARSHAQAQELVRAAKEGSCVFCKLNFEKNKPLNKRGEFDPEGKDWPLLWVWVNPFPQEHHLLHLMIVPRRHFVAEFDSDFTPEEWSQVLDAWNWAVRYFLIPGGGFVCRFGNSKYNAGTIGHAHCQLQVPDLTGNVKATFCKSQTPEDEERRAERKLPPEKRWLGIAKEAIRVHETGIADDLWSGPPYGGYAYLLRNSSRFVGPDFKPMTAPFFFHWEADRYVREVLKRKYPDEQVVSSKAMWVSLDGAVPVGPDALNWINDTEIDFSALVAS